MSDSKPKKGWRRRQNATKYQVAAQCKRKPSNQYPEEDGADIAIDRLVKDINRHANEQRAERQSEKCWHKAEVIGLWAAAFVGATAIVVGTCDADRQREVMQRTLEEMQAEQRPWIGAPMIKPDPVGGVLSFTNIGKSPAVGLFLSAQTITDKTSNAEIARKVEGMCKDASQRSLVGANAKYTLDPNEPQSFSDNGAEIRTSFHLSNILDSDRSRIKPEVYPRIIGCIVYGPKLGGRLHSTGFFAGVEWRRGAIFVDRAQAIDED